ncbi:MAG TPA: PCRF domain-containing protein, partial [Massilibacterium sp.]|nr:PCRF domain-containing protein [Massilibacterium sp.]
MLERLKAIEERYNTLNELLSNPETMNDMDKFREYSKEQASIQEIVEVYRKYADILEQLDGAKEMLDDQLDEEMQEMVQEEVKELEEEEEELREKLKILLLPKDPNDDKNVIVEIRGAAGGDEAALFAADLYRMYSRYAEAKGWKTEIIEANYTELGGYKEVIFMITGQGAYSRLKYENGAHRVQRVPSTESGGRIHTSTATVAVLPEAEEVEVDVHEKDIR